MRTVYACLMCLIIEDNRTQIGKTDFFDLVMRALSVAEYVKSAPLMEEVCGSLACLLEDGTSRYLSWWLVSVSLSFPPSFLPSCMVDRHTQKSRVQPS
jgi:hypothetical protein